LISQCGIKGAVESIYLTLKHLVMWNRRSLDVP
jgi:hypothetical protein